MGNGPSLADTPLEHLIGEVSFATNRINLIYPRTDWRPTHYVRAEGPELLHEDKTSLWEEEVLTHIDMSDVETWMNVYYQTSLSRVGYDVKPDHVISQCAHYQTNYYDERCPHWWHLPLLCSYGSSVHVAIQIAVQKGYYPIYLVGCDLGYKDNEPSHFTDEYEVGYEGLLRPANEANINMLIAHVVARRASPVPIYNASVGGSLEVYERVDYNEVVRNRKWP